MQTILCKQCQATLNWDGESAIVRCAYCGTQYRMHPRSEFPSGVTVGQGTISPIRTTHGRFAGRALVKSYVPKNWTVETNAPEQQANLLCPLTVQVAYTSPNQDAFITFTGTRAYNHLELTPQTAQMQGQISYPDRMIGLAFRDASAVCDEIINSNPSLKDARLLSSSDIPDSWARAVQEKEIQGYAQAGLLNPGSSWTKKYFTVKDAQGQVWHKLIEAMVLIVKQN